MTSVQAAAAGVVDEDRRRVLSRRVQLIVATIIGYNLLEAVVAISAGSVASSGALVSFGLQSVVEVLSAAAIAWQFSAPDPRTREHAALRTVAVAFFALAAYVTYHSVSSLLRGGANPEHTPVGIAVAAASVIVMPLLSWLERRTGRELGSASVVADSKQTLLCTYLSGVLLVGLLFNSLFGWGWADPVAALVIAAAAVREGVDAWRGDSCCASTGALLTGHADADVGAEPGRAAASCGCGDDCGDSCCSVPDRQVVDEQVGER